MNKIKEMISGHHEKDVHANDGKVGTHDGLNAAQVQGRENYEAGNPTYAGQTSGSGHHDLKGTTEGPYSSTTGTTGASDVGRHNQGAFSVNDPTSARGIDSQGGSSDIYNDRTGHTHSTTGQHTNDATFRNDPTSAQTSSMTGGGAGLATSELTDRSTSGYQSGSGMTSGMTSAMGMDPSRHAAHDQEAYASTHHHSTTGGPHQTFTANRLDPHASEEIPSFHEEHLHGNRVEHGRQGLSTEQYANEHYDPSRGPDFVGGIAGSGMSSSTGYDNDSSRHHTGRDAAIGGAGLAGVAGAASHHDSSSRGIGDQYPFTGGDSRHEKQTNTSGLPIGSTGTGHHSGMGSNTGSESIQERAKQAIGGHHFGEQQKDTGYRSGPGYGKDEKHGPVGHHNQSHNDSHLGRDAALGGAGVGALGAGAYEHEHNKPSATQRYDDNTQRYDDSVERIGAGSSAGVGVDHTHQTPAPDRTGPHFSGGHFRSLANEPRDTSSSHGLTSHEIKAHEKNEEEREKAAKKSGGMLGGLLGGGKHHDDKSYDRSHTDKLEDSYAGRRDQRDADAYPTHDNHHTGQALGAGAAGVGAMGAVGAASHQGGAHHGSAMSGSDNSLGQSSSQYPFTGGLNAQPTGTAVGSSSGLGSSSTRATPGSSTHVNGTGGDHSFGQNLRNDGHHHYGQGNTTSDYVRDGNSSKRHGGYNNYGSSSAYSGVAGAPPMTRSTADSEAYDPANPNYGSSSAIGSTDGYAQRSGNMSSDPTSGLEGTNVGAHNNQYSSGEHERSGVSKLLHREHPNKLHKEPAGGNYPSQ